MIETYKDTSFYVGTTLSNRQAALKVVVCLIEQLGMKNTYMWDAWDPSEYPTKAAEELDAVRRSDICIFLLPGKMGTQAEVGAALMAKLLLRNRRVILHAKEASVFTHVDRDAGIWPNIFWHHPYCELIAGDDEVRTVLNHLLATR